MTRKHYVILAEALNKTRPAYVGGNPRLASDAYRQWQQDVRFIVNALTQDNPRFNPERFYTACGFAL